MLWACLVQMCNQSISPQALQYLRKVCNHPALVLSPSHPKYKEMLSCISQSGSNLHDIVHAPKLTALK